MIYLLDSTKVPFILSHAHHAHVLLFLSYTVLSHLVLLGLRFIHNKVFFFRFLAGEWYQGHWLPHYTLSQKRGISIEWQELFAIYSSFKPSHFKCSDITLHSRLLTSLAQTILFLIPFPVFRWTASVPWHPRPLPQPPPSLHQR